MRYPPCHTCGDQRDELFPWHYRGTPVEVCESCHPKCEVPGCKELMMLGGDFGGCVKHEAMSELEFIRLIRSAEMRAQ